MKYFIFTLLFILSCNKEIVEANSCDFDFYTIHSCKLIDGRKSMQFVADYKSTFLLKPAELYCNSTGGFNISIGCEGIIFDFEITSNLQYVIEREKAEVLAMIDGKVFVAQRGYVNVAEKGDTAVISFNDVLFMHHDGSQAIGSGKLTCQ